MSDHRLYFAYGSNINLDQMARRCPYAEPIGPVELPNYRLAFRASGVATILPEEGSTVHGLLWNLTPECELSLDHYEGFPYLYEKQDLQAHDASGQTFSVMAYVMTPEHARVIAEPIPYYCAGIRAGFIQNGMAVPAFDHAVKRGQREAREALRDPWQDFGKKLQGTKKPKKKKPYER